MHVPILKVDDFWIVSVQSALEDKSVIELKNDLLEKLSYPDTKGLLIDISILDVVDSFVTRILIEINSLSSLMGIPVVITGMNPSIAITLVEMGLDFNEIRTVMNLQKGIDILRMMIKERYDGNKISHSV